MRITDPALRDRIVQAIGDPDSPKILHVIKETPKDAQTISSETGIPLSSVYRKVAILRNAGLVFVRSFEITPEGKRQDKYLSAVNELRLQVSGEVLEIELVPSDENARRVWFTLFNS